MSSQNTQTCLRAGRSKISTETRSKLSSNRMSSFSRRLGTRWRITLPLVLSAVLCFVIDLVGAQQCRGTLAEPDTEDAPKVYVVPSLGSGHVWWSLELLYSLESAVTAFKAPYLPKVTPQYTLDGSNWGPSLEPCQGNADSGNESGLIVTFDRLSPVIEAQTDDFAAELQNGIKITEDGRKILWMPDLSKIGDNHAGSWRVTLTGASTMHLAFDLVIATSCAVSDAPRAALEPYLWPS